MAMNVLLVVSIVCFIFASLALALVVTGRTPAPRNEDHTSTRAAYPEK